jgi:hypothetical protein
MPDAYKLVSTVGDQSIDVQPGRTVIVGRAVTSDAPIFEPSISRRHAELTVRQGGVQVKDLDSANGTFINGNRIMEGVAAARDVVTFGTVAFTVHAATVTAATITARRTSAPTLLGPLLPPLAESDAASAVIPTGHGEYLAALGEEPLCDAPEKLPATFRLLQLPSFGFPSIVRACRHAEGWEVACKIADTRRGLVPGRLAWQDRRLLDASEAAQMEQLCDALQFWSMPAEARRMGMDGYTWVLEGVENGRYHAIHRWCPDDPPLQAFGEFLLEVSGVHAYLSAPEVRKAWRQAAQAAQRAYDEAAQLRSEAIARSNARAVRLAARLSAGGLSCPRCHTHTRDMRFLASESSQQRSHFVCGLCGGSFDPDDVADD